MWRILCGFLATIFYVIGITYGSRNTFLVVFMKKQIARNLTALFDCNPLWFWCNINIICLCIYIYSHWYFSKMAQYNIKCLYSSLTGRKKNGWVTIGWTYFYCQWYAHRSQPSGCRAQIERDKAAHCRRPMCAKISLKLEEKCTVRRFKQQQKTILLSKCLEKSCCSFWMLMRMASCAMLRNNLDTLLISRRRKAVELLLGSHRLFIWYAIFQKFVTIFSFPYHTHCHSLTIQETVQ